MTILDPPRRSADHGARQPLCVGGGAIRWGARIVGACGWAVPV